MIQRMQLFLICALAIVLQGCGADRSSVSQPVIQEVKSLRVQLGKSVERQQLHLEWGNDLHRYSYLIFGAISAAEDLQGEVVNLSLMNENLSKLGLKCSEFALSELEIRYFLNKCQVGGFPVCSEISILNLSKQMEAFKSVGCKF